jgi:DNA-binding MarR family transcriptional regulator
MTTTSCLTLLGQASGHPTDRKKNRISCRAIEYTTRDKTTPEVPMVKKSLQAKDYDALGAFRYAMRKFLRVSKEVVAARAKLTPEQCEALLAIKSSSGTDCMTVGEISERLQVKHHTVVSLLDKLEARKLATGKRAAGDRRNVNVQLTKAGTLLLTRLAAIHHRELQQRSPEIIDALRRIRE